MVQIIAQQYQLDAGALERRRLPPPLAEAPPGPVRARVRRRATAREGPRELPLRALCSARPRDHDPRAVPAPAGALLSVSLCAREAACPERPHLLYQHRLLPHPPAVAARTAPAAPRARGGRGAQRSEEHTSELQSRLHLVFRLLLEK